MYDDVSDHVVDHRIDGKKLVFVSFGIEALGIVARRIIDRLKVTDEDGAHFSEQRRIAGAGGLAFRRLVAAQRVVAAQRHRLGHDDAAVDASGTPGAAATAARTVVPEPWMDLSLGDDWLAASGAPP